MLSLYSPERKTGAFTLCPSKHLGNFIVKWTVEKLSRLGFVDIRLRTDGDVTMKGLALRVQSGRSHKTIIEETSRQAHQSIGGAERFHRLIQEEARVLKGTLEKKLNCELKAEPAFASWLFRHVSWVLYRYHVPRDLGMTPFRALFGTNYSGQVACFGEAILARRTEDCSNRASFIKVVLPMVQSFVDWKDGVF